MGSRRGFAEFISIGSRLVRVLAFWIGLGIVVGSVSADAICAARQTKGPLDAWIPLPLVLDAEILEDHARYWLMMHQDSRPLEAIAESHGMAVPFEEPMLLIEKAEFSLGFYSKGTLLKRYPLAIGKYTFEGPKFQEGDARTPEGDYFVCRKLTEESLKNPLMGSRWMQISYPNPDDAALGLQMGLIAHDQYEAIARAIADGVMPPQNTAMGGGIGIHGGYFDDLGKSTKTWTGGCIGMRNSDIEELFEHTPLNTPVRIVP